MHRVPRTRTGCLPCRRRKKKCDEAKPQCQACTRNKLQCAWPPHIVRIFGLDAEQTQNVDDLHSSKGSGSPVEVQGVGTPPPIPSAASATKDPITTSEGAEHRTGERKNRSISWSLTSVNFLSSIQTAGMLLPESPMLLSHYLEDTAPKLAPVSDVPWVSWILPVAYNDDLLMNAILALSGGHLLYKLPGNQEIIHATSQHYSSAVRALYQVFSDESMISEPLALLRVALAILILFHYEVVSGNLNGSPFTHLRATRRLVLNLRSKKSNRSMSAAEQKLYGFVMEVYSYIVLCNSITPLNMNCNRTLIYDPFLQTLDDLRDLGAFGVMFSGCHHLFELISSVSLFVPQNPNTDHDEEYLQLKTRIVALDSSAPNEPDARLRPGCSAIFQVYRIALLLFLETTNSPFSKYNIIRMQHLQPLLDTAVLKLPQILPSNHSSILMWPIMIVGSCLMEEEQRALISHMLLHNQYGMRNTAQASMLLELLWNDPDEHAFGPYGLGLLMNRHNLDYGVI